MAMMRRVAAWFDHRRRLLSAVWAGWVIVLVVASGRTPAAGEWVTIPDLGGLLVALLAAVALVGLAMIMYFRPNVRSGRGRRAPLSPWTAVLVAIVFALVAIAFDPPTQQEEEPVEPTIPQVDIEQSPGGLANDVAGSGDDLNIVVLLAIATGAAVVMLWSRQRRAVDSGTHSTATPVDAADLAPAVEEMTMQLQLGTEPRAAVLNAYATLERALADRGQPRRPVETPSEHMERAMAASPLLASPAIQLGRLYELARFSNHPITELDRTTAAEELRRARSILANAGATP